MRAGSSSVITCEENGSTLGTEPTCDRKDNRLVDHLRP